MTAPAPAAAAFRRLRRLLLGLLAVAVCGEVALRLADAALDRPTGSLYDHIVPAGDRYKLTPGGRVVAPERYGDIEYRFNRQGYRDRDHDPAAPGERIVLLGDSVTFGLGAAYADIYPVQLAGLLSQRYGPRYEVVNLAIFAYDTQHELEALAEDGLGDRPTLVVVQFYLNDFAIHAPRGDGPPPRLSLGQRLVGLKNLLLYRSNLYRRLHQLATTATYRFFHDRRRLAHPATLNRAEPVDKLRYLTDHPDDADVPAFVALRRIADLAREHGARTLVLLSPDEVQLFDAAYDGIQARFARFAANAEIPFLDLLPGLRAEPKHHKLFLDGVHLSPRGHRRVAELLLAELVRRGLVGEAAPAP